MNRAKKSMLVAACAAAAVLTAGAASASLNVFQTYSGTVGLTTSGCGSSSQACNLTANVPVGSTVVAAYLYSSMYTNGTASGTFNGSAVNYTALGSNGFLEASRADVTSLVAPTINGGAGGAYTFGVTENNGAMDGEALVLVYSNASLATSTIGILDGFSASGGDSSSISFATPLNPSAAGFHAEMRIGDGFGFNPGGQQSDSGAKISGSGQFSTIDVNGVRMTNAAGNFDDGQAANGALITVGDDNDPFTVASPGSPQDFMDQDHERYNLIPFIHNGDTTIHLVTTNPSSDDNIFLETFQVTGEAVIHGNSGAPEPATWAMMIGGFGLAGAALRRRRAVAA